MRGGYKSGLSFHIESVFWGRHVASAPNWGADIDEGPGNSEILSAGLVERPPLTIS
jgi:hypothetical protein